MHANIANISVITKAFLLESYFNTKTLKTAPSAPPIVNAANFLIIMIILYNNPISNALLIEKAFSTSVDIIFIYPKLIPLKKLPRAALKTIMFYIYLFLKFLIIFYIKFNKMETQLWLTILKWINILAA